MNYLTKNFNKINTLADIELIYSYYNEYTVRRKYPRFFMSLLYLMDNGDYYYGIVDDCLCILKKKMIGQPIVYLTIPPIAKVGRVSKEKRVVNLFKEAKIKTRFSEEDISLYGLDINTLEHKKGLDEFIYPIQDTVLLQGKEWESFRRFNNKFKGFKIKTINKDIPYEDILKAKTLNKTWEIYKKNNNQITKNRAYKTVSTIDIIDVTNNDKMLFTAIYDEIDNLICYDLSEKINDSNIILVTRYFDYTNEYVNNSVYPLHYNACKFWYDSRVGGYANFGSSVGDKALYASKLRLKPVKILKLYEEKNVGKLTLNEYHNICKTKGDLI